VYATVIPRNVRLGEAPGFGKPIIEYDKECAGAVSYTSLAREFLQKNRDVIVEAAADSNHEAHEDTKNREAEVTTEGTEHTETDVVSTDKHAPTGPLRGMEKKPEVCTTEGTESTETETLSTDFTD
jgi:hypothetical protein